MNGVLLKEESITDFLAKLINYLAAGNTEQAKFVIDLLQFDRITRLPFWDNSKPPQYHDPAEPYGRERVDKTGNHLHSCAIALRIDDLEAALTAAREAQIRWLQRQLG